MSLPVDEHLALGNDIQPGHDILSGRFACYGTYQTSDGKWLAVGAIEAKFFANLCRALGHGELIALQLDDASQATIRDALAGSFATKTRDEWVALLGDADTCVSPVLSIGEVEDDPQFKARGVVTSAVHPTQGSFNQLAPLLAGMHKESQPFALPDPEATVTEHLLKEAGVDGDTIAGWMARKVVA
jgi:alpha-methylacyl-CoA racemase